MRVCNFCNETSSCASKSTQGIVGPRRYEGGFEDCRLSYYLQNLSALCGDAGSIIEVKGLCTKIKAMHSPRPNYIVCIT